MRVFYHTTESFLVARNKENANSACPFFQIAASNQKELRLMVFLAVVALWVTKPKFMVNIPVFLRSHSLKLHEGLFYPKVSRSTYCSSPCHHRFLPAIKP